MQNTKFWSPQGLNLKNKFSKKVEKEESVMNSKTVKPKKSFKSLGVTGSILGVIVIAVVIVMYIFLIRPGIALFANANVLKKDMDAISQSLTDRDLVALNEVLDKTDTDLEAVRSDRDSKFGWAKDTKAFKLSEYYSDSERFINAGVLAVDALRQLSVVVTPFADAAGLKLMPDQEVPEDDGLLAAFKTWVSIMPEVADDMDGVIATLSAMGKELEPVNVDKYPKSFRGVPIRDNIAFAKNTLSKAGEYAPDIKEALTIIPSLLGVDSYLPKRYFVIFLNDKEIRPTGGFQTYFATFKMLGGELKSDFTSYNFYVIDDKLAEIDATYDFPDAPPAYAKYLKVERWYARDTNSSPDLPNSIDNLMFYYNMASRIDPNVIKPIDGIITIDTRVLEELLEVTGPVTVNGLTYSSDNVVLELERIASLALAEQANRKRVLGDLMEEMMINVFESDKNIWPKLIEKSIDLAARKHIQGYSFDESAQGLIEKYNIGGRILDPVEGDYGMVVQTNLGGDKTNWFVDKKVTHELSQENGKWVKTVTLDYTYPQPSDDFAPFIKRFRDWVRVYAPAGSELISVSGGQDQETEISDQERGKVWYSAYLELGPNENHQVVFKYYLPEGVVSGDKYNFTLQKQAGISKEKHIIKINGKVVDELDLDKDTTKSYDL